MSYRQDFKDIQRLSTKQFRSARQAIKKGFSYLFGKRDNHVHTFFGMVARSRRKLRSHGVIIGDTGSGKTLIGNTWIGYSLANRKPDDLFVFFDPKGNTVQMLEGLGVKYHIISIDDNRGLGLDIMSDCMSPTDLYAATKVINPGSKGANDFWPNIALGLLFGCGNSAVEINYRAPLLATIIRVLQMPPQENGEDFLFKFLSYSPDNARLIQVLKSGESILAGALAEAIASLLRLSAAAAHDARVKKRISMYKFVRRLAMVDGEPVRVLVFNRDIRSLQASEAYFRIAFQLLVSNILALPDCVDDPNHPLINIFIDEYPFVSSSGFNQMEMLASVGRTKGAHLLLILQSVNQMYHCHGKEEGQAIFNSLPEVIFTATGSAENARFLAEKLGQVYVNETKLSSSEGERGKNYTTAETKELRHVQPTGALLNLPYPSKERGLFFYQIDSDHKGDSAEPIAGHWSGALVDEMKPPTDKSVPGLVSRDPSYYYMPPLSDVEREHLVTGVSPLFDEMVWGMPDLPDLDENPIVADMVEALQDDASRVIEGETPRYKEFINIALNSVLNEYESGLDRYMKETYGTSGRH